MNRRYGMTAIILILMIVNARSDLSTLNRGDLYGFASRQGNTMNCAAVSLYVMLRLKNIDAEYHEISQIFPQANVAVNSSQIIKTASQYGWDTKLYKVSRDILFKLRSPAIIHTVRPGHDSDSPIEHYIVVEPIDNDRVRVIDPPYRSSIMTRKKFSKSKIVTGYIIPSSPSELRHIKHSVILSKIVNLLLMTSILGYAAILTWGKWRRRKCTE